MTLNWMYVDIAENGPVNIINETKVVNTFL